MMTRALVAVAFFLSTSAFAYPISPKTLWDLTSEAELIVVARVEHLRGEAFAPRSFTEAATNNPSARHVDDLARLRVVETLKGSAAQSLEVVTSAGSICPAPGRFVVGELMVAFLSSYGGRWHALGLSYGTLYPDAEELPVMKERIAAAVALQKTKFAPEQRLDWAVATAARRATRWHGAYELASATDEMHSFYDEKKREPAQLTELQLRALADGFINEPSADETTVMMLRLLRKQADPRLDAAFVGAVDSLLERDPRSAIPAMEDLVARAGGDPALLEGIWDSGDEVLRRRWQAAREELRLPSGAKLAPRKVPVQNVGQSTPP